MTDDADSTGAVNTSVDPRAITQAFENDSPLWHPFTQHGLTPQMVPVARAEGAWLSTPDDHRIFDAISSWWVITHGHRHPAIMQAVAEQLETLDQVIFAGFTHEPAERLAKALVELAPDGLTRVFLSDSGSTAVEVAIKMALGHFRNRGQPRDRIVTLEHAYHGDTVGAMSAGARGVFTSAYEPLLFETTRIPFPAQGAQQHTLDALDAACRDDSTAALLVEPLILGAGGMLMYDAETLTQMHEICRANGVLFIADEVMTGWGRTGLLWACDHAGISPDILCTAKGLTGGSLPLAATVCTEEIYASHLSTDRARMFFHSSSFTANPVCCAAALANTRIWQDEPVQQRIDRLCERQAAHLDQLTRNHAITNARKTGTIAAFDLATDTPGYLSGMATRLLEWFVHRGVLIRPLGNTIYIMPPYCSSDEDLGIAYERISEAITYVSEN